MEKEDTKYTLTKIGAALGALFVAILAGGGGGVLITQYLQKSVPVAIIEDVHNPKQIVVGDTLIFDGSKSNDPKQGTDNLNYIWSVFNAEVENDLQRGSGVQQFFIPTEEGRYTVQLTVSNEDGNKHKDTRHFIVLPVSKKTSKPKQTPLSTVKTQGPFQICIGESTAVCKSAQFSFGCSAKLTEQAEMTNICKNYSEKAVFKSLSRRVQSGGRCGYIFHTFICQW